MKPFHYVDTSRPSHITVSAPGTWWWAGLAVILLLVLYAATQRADEASDARVQASQQAEVNAAFEAGRLQGRAELLPTVRSAWQAGINEAQGRCSGKKL